MPEDRAGDAAGDVASVVRRALVEEACKRSSVCWLALPARPQPYPAWHVWVDGAACVVSGGREQPLPGLGRVDEVSVTVPSKDKGGRLVTWTARPRTLDPHSLEWATAVKELHAKRLNSPDGEAQPARWAAESTVTRLQPTGAVTEEPGRMPLAAGAAEPALTPASTRGPLPFVLGRRARRRRPRR